MRRLRESMLAIALVCVAAGLALPTQAQVSASAGAPAHVSLSARDAEVAVRDLVAAADGPAQP